MIPNPKPEQDQSKFLSQSKIFQQTHCTPSIIREFDSCAQAVGLQGAKETEWKFCPRPRIDAASASSAASSGKKKEKAGKKSAAAGLSAADMEAACKRSAASEFRPAEPSPRLLIGLQLDATHAHRLLDIGPAADDKQAALVFRAFWGARSEMRRFKDGAILEAVLWADALGADADATAAAGAQAASPLGAPDAEDWPLTRIARHVLQRHLDLSPDAVRPLATQLSHTLQPSLPAWQTLPPSAARAQPAPSAPAANIDPQRESTALRAAFDRLSALLKAAPGLPLTITNLQPTHSAFRYASVWLPAAIDLGSDLCAPLDALSPIPSLMALAAQGGPADADEAAQLQEQATLRLRFGLEPVDVLLQFESSARWPDDVTAIARLKTAFYLRISQGEFSVRPLVFFGSEFRTCSHLFLAVMASEHNIESVVSEGHVDLFVDGYVFRLRLLYEKEVHLLKLDGEFSLSSTRLVVAFHSQVLFLFYLSMNLLCSLASGGANRIGVGSSAAARCSDEGFSIPLPLVRTLGASSQALGRRPPLLRARERRSHRAADGARVCPPPPLRRARQHLVGLSALPALACNAPVPGRTAAD